MSRLIRAVLGVLLCVAPALSLAASQEWRFKVSLDGHDIGYHRFTLNEGARRETLRTKAHFTVSFLWFNAYTYEHHNVEFWRDGCLTNIESKTNDNGDIQAVRGVATANGFALDQPESKTIQGCVMTYAYWNPEFLKRERLLNAQTGEVDRVTVRALGEETIKVRGSAVRAERFAVVNPQLRIDLWYSSAREWLALESTLESGRRLHYELQ